MSNLCCLHKYLQ